MQGVGFRPFVYNLAVSLSLAGFVFNSTAGVTLEIEGPEDALDTFVQRLREHPPQLAEIASIVVTEMDVQGSGAFSILDSRKDATGFALVPPDIGTCAECRREFEDPANRRFGYPFTNCIHCGPRYTIIRGLPYDRATTTMLAFTMCAACQAEYDNPADRRFHAQPNACAVCGPSLTLTGFAHTDSLSIIRQALALLRSGRILAVKGLGGFLLACDATNDAAVAELRRRKRRPHKPFALMARDLAAVRKLCTVTEEDAAALLHPRRPIVVLPRLPDSPLSAHLAPGDRTLGVMLPYTPLHYLLFSDSPEMQSELPALVMTSGNLSEEPIVVHNQEALQHLDKVADDFLLHNRDIATRVDDSVVRVFFGRERVLRRARGFAPQTIDLGLEMDLEMDEVLAFGGELKNTFCLTKGRYAILSQHIGDLENYETMRFFEETLDRMKHVFKVSPRAVAYDLHPGYMSTRMALAGNIEPRIGVQHHHAHIASCMAENHLRGRVLGVALDGTGFGTDGRIWGGEFLVADFAGFTRRAHLRNVLLPGGDAAVRQPWRMALSYLQDALGTAVPTFQGIEDKQVALVNTMLARRIQTVETSSCGRLFDAVAAMLGLASEVTFEGQAAIALEAQAEQGIDDRYDFSLDHDAPIVLDFRPMTLAIMKDISSGRRVGEISACFHNTLCAAIGEVCSRIRASDGVHRVCLSGGSFQNLYLLGRTVVELRHRGFEVFLHAAVPANDGGLSLGQAMVANERLRRGE